MEKTKRWLSRGYFLRQKVKALYGSKERAFSLACGYGGGNKNREVVQTSKKNNQEKRTVSYSEYAKWLEKRIKKLEATLLEIQEVIEKVPDNMLQTLLIERYINFRTWEQIAEKIDKSVFWTRDHLHKKALSMVKKILLVEKRGSL